MRKNRWVWIALPWAGWAALLIYVAAVWQQLPAQMAVHFAVRGTPDSYADRGVAVFIIVFALTLALAVLSCSFVSKGWPTERLAFLHRGYFLLHNLLGFFLAGMSVWMIWFSLHTPIGRR